MKRTDVESCLSVAKQMSNVRLGMSVSIVIVFMQEQNCYVQSRSFIHLNTIVKTKLSIKLSTYGHNRHSYHGNFENYF